MCSIPLETFDLVFSISWSEVCCRLSGIWGRLGFWDLGADRPQTAGPRQRLASTTLGPYILVPSPRPTPRGLPKPTCLCTLLLLLPVSAFSGNTRLDKEEHSRMPAPWGSNREASSCKAALESAQGRPRNPRGLPLKSHDSP